MIACPGCGLLMPETTREIERGYYNCSTECWSVYTEVLAAEYSNAPLFGAVHQLTVDTYAVQHAGGPHPDKSVAVHFAGLHLVYAHGRKPVEVAPILQRIASAARAWPHFEVPRAPVTLTVADIALCSTMIDHIERVREWSRQVYAAWSDHHEAIGAFIDEYFYER
jgi:hypothetical protein